MDLKRRKELLDEWKNRRPEMGVIAVRCGRTGDMFLGVSKDTGASFNSICFKLSANCHPNRQLQALWNMYGGDDFKFSVEKKLKHENPGDDQTEKLEALLDKCLEEMPDAGRI